MRLRVSMTLWRDQSITSNTLFPHYYLMMRSLCILSFDTTTLSFLNRVLHLKKTDGART